MPCRGDTALHLAAQSGHAVVVEKLIVAKAKVDAGNKYGRCLGKLGLDVVQMLSSLKFYHSGAKRLILSST